jgi:N-formylglutamate amidohydrolase
MDSLVSTTRNRPYNGTYVPLKYLGKDKRVSSIMFEVNRNLYMNESSGEKLIIFPEMKNILKELINNLLL